MVHTLGAGSDDGSENSIALATSFLIIFLYT